MQQGNFIVKIKRNLVNILSYTKFLALFSTPQLQEGEFVDRFRVGFVDLQNLGVKLKGKCKLV